MLRRSLFCLLAGALAPVIAVPPASAAEIVTPVDLIKPTPQLERRAFFNCGDPSVSPAPYDVSSVMDASAGSGWAWHYDMEDSGWAAGLTAHVEEPELLTAMTVDHMPTVTGASGFASVKFIVPTAGRGPDETWLGRSQLDGALDSVAGGTWWTIDARKLDFVWTHYSPEGAFIENAPTSTIAEFASERVAASWEAWIGFAFGCDGSDFRLDNLRIGRRSTISNYDLTAGDTSTAIASRLPGESTWTNPSRRTVLLDRCVVLAADAFQRYQVGIAEPVTGTLQLLTKTHTGPWLVADEEWQVSAEDETYVSHKVCPRKNTRYYFRMLPNDDNLPSESARVQIRVKPRVVANPGPRALVVGRKISLSGRVQPQKARVPVLLQRKVGKQWKVVSRGLTRANGAYALSVRATTSGTWLMRVAVNAAQGNLAGESPNRYFKVAKPRTPVTQPTQTDPEYQADPADPVIITNPFVPRSIVKSFV